MSEITQAYPDSSEETSYLYSRQGLTFDVTPSVRLRWIVARTAVVLLLLIVIAIFDAYGTTWMALGLSLSGALLPGLYWWQFLHWHKRQGGRLEVTADSWSWQEKMAIREGSRNWRIVHDIVLWNFLIVLPLGCQSGKQQKRLVLLPDSASSEDLRKLRVYLKTRRWKAPSRHSN